MSEEKFMPGPWELELIQKRPFGVCVTAADGREVLSQHAYCFSTTQQTRRDCELGVGFEHNSRKGWTTITDAQKGIAEQDATARIIVEAPAMYRELSHLVSLLEPLERGGSLNVPGLATLNNARAIIARVKGEA